MAEMNFVLDLCGNDCQQVEAELSIRRDTVEVRCGDRLVGIADRAYLRAWLKSPGGMYMCDDMAWGWTGWAIAVHIKGLVPGSYLKFEVWNTLRMYV